MVPPIVIGICLGRSGVSDEDQESRRRREEEKSQVSLGTVSVLMPNHMQWLNEF